MAAETFRGPWGAPTMMALEGASFGFQLGGQATDFVLLLMSPRSASSILNSKVKIGGDASAAAGPVGRDTSAETDAAMRAEILSYSRARGLFAGISLSGSTLRADNDGNTALYGKKLERIGDRLRSRSASATFREIAPEHAREEIAEEPLSCSSITSTSSGAVRLTAPEEFRAPSPWMPLWCQSPCGELRAPV